MVLRTIFMPTTMKCVDAMVQLFEALGYKPKGRGFDCQCCYSNFSLT